MTTPPAPRPSEAAQEALIGRLLVDARSRKPVRVTDGGRIVTEGGMPAGRMVNGVALMLENPPASYFDDKFAVMQSGHERRDGEWEFAYLQQLERLTRRLAHGGVVLDIGCGPALPYEKPPQATVIGLEYSLPSIAANRQVDLRVCASAASIPLPDASVDTIVCLYSVHHMTGGRVGDANALVGQALAEFARVLKADGECLIFEMSPLPPFGAFQRLAWNLAKRILGPQLDMYFWPRRPFARHAAAHGWSRPVEVVEFRSSPWTTFPAVFSLPWLRLPRFLYPLAPVLYRLRH